jgi:SAM-dependent methyltransferase
MIARLMKRLHAPVYAARLTELVRRIVPHLREGDRVLDVGCGVGALGRAILDSPDCPPGVTVLGLERVRRQNEAIEVQEYDGVTIPHFDDSFDVVILADVLHHEPDPHRLIDQCVRISRRLLIIKDHRLAGPFAHSRITLLDWAANAPYGVPCLYRYNTPDQWRQWLHQHRLQPVEQLESMRLYPRMYNWFFGGRLQYLAVLRVPQVQAAPTATSLNLNKENELCNDR